MKRRPCSVEPSNSMTESGPSTTCCKGSLRASATPARGHGLSLRQRGVPRALPERLGSGVVLQTDCFLEQLYPLERVHSNGCCSRVVQFEAAAWGEQKPVPRPCQPTARRAPCVARRTKRPRNNCSHQLSIASFHRHDGVIFIPVDTPTCNCLACRDHGSCTGKF